MTEKWAKTLFSHFSYYVMLVLQIYWMVFVSWTEPNYKSKCCCKKGVLAVDENCLFFTIVKLQVQVRSRSGQGPGQGPG